MIENRANILLTAGNVVGAGIVMSAEVKDSVGVMSMVGSGQWPRLSSDSSMTNLAAAAQVSHSRQPTAAHGRM